MASKASGTGSNKEATPTGQPELQELAQEADLAQAFKELSKGEKTASAMEHQLTNLERKIDDLLASAEEQQHDVAAHMLAGNHEEIVGKEVADT